MKIKKLTPSIPVIMIMVCLSACSTSTPSLNPITITTPTQAVMADCFRSIRVTAWEDLDGNGVRGATEPALQGARFDLNGPFAEIISGDPFISDADGRLDIGIWSPGNCSKGTYTITATPPESYEPTTPNPISFSLTPADFLYEAQFGFRAASK